MQHYYYHEIRLVCIRCENSKRKLRSGKKSVIRFVLIDKSTNGKCWPKDLQNLNLQSQNHTQKTVLKQKKCNCCFKMRQFPFSFVVHHFQLTAWVQLLEFLFGSVGFFFNFSSRALYTVNRPRAWRAKRIYCSLIPLEFDCVRATFGPVIHVDDFNFSTEIHNRTKKQTSKIRVPFFIPSLSRSRFSTNECTFFLGVCVCVCLSNLCGDIYSSVNR